MIHLPDIESSLVKSIEYDENNCEITFFFVEKYFVDQLTYVDFGQEYFDTLLCTNSIGKFYLHFITTNFKLKNMADTTKRPKTKNESSTKKRFIKIRIDVTKFEKDLFFEGEKGTYADVTLQLMPDGTTDKHGSLGMVTQDIPKAVWEKDKKRQGQILGNGYEYDWNSVSTESMPGQGEYKEPSQEAIDDLPF